MPRTVRPSLILASSMLIGAVSAGAVEAEPARILLAQNQQSEREAREERRERRREAQEQRREERRDERSERRERRDDDRRRAQEQRQEQQRARQEQREQRRQQADDARERQQRARQERAEQERRQRAEQRERRQQAQEERRTRQQAAEEERERRQQAEERRRRRGQEEATGSVEDRRERRERARNQDEDARGGRRAQQDEERGRRRERDGDDDRADRRRNRNDDGDRAERRGNRGDDRDRAERRRDRDDRRAGEGRDGRGRADRDRDGGREVSREERRERREKRREFTRERLKDITRRRQRREENGRVIIVEPNERRIIRDRGRVIIEHDETNRLRGAARDFSREEIRGGRVRTVITRPNGVKIITVEGRNGRLLRRVKEFPNGRRVVLINNEFERRGRRRDRDRDGFGFYVDLPDFRLTIPQEEYYVGIDDADEDEIEQVLTAAPVEEFEEDYTLDEIRYSEDIRKRFRRLNLNTINFAFGSWEVPDAEIDELAKVARVINRILERNPDEVFLVAGFTDAVGSEEDNLSLSDRRAETVARILADEFGVPPENLVTQGYGETDLLVETQEAELRNRRVEFMRITPALAQRD